MRATLTLWAVLASLPGAVCAGEWPSAATVGRGGTLGPGQADKLVDALVKTCPLLNEFRLHVASITYELIKTTSYGGDYHYRLYGWPRMVEIAMTLASDTPVPPGLEGTGPIAGDAMLFDLGSGRRPGLIVSKPTSRYVCGAPVSGSDDVFISAPAAAAQLQQGGL